MESIFSLKDKYIWVLGAAGYLGQETVKVLHGLGARVLCLDLGDRASNFVGSQAFGEHVVADTFDVGDVEQIDHTLDDLLTKYTVPDGLVNLTFGSTARALEDLDYAEFDKANQINLTSTFAICRRIGVEMLPKQKGAMVLFSSMYGMGAPYPEVYPAPMIKNPIEYGVGKAGVIQMTKYLAVHWGKQGVRCNCVSPGPFPNPTVQQTQPGFIKSLSDKSPMGRIGQAIEIAGAVAFLLSDASSYVNGHNLVVDGGWTGW